MWPLSPHAAEQSAEVQHLSVEDSLVMMVTALSSCTTVNYSLVASLLRVECDHEWHPAIQCGQQSAHEFLLSAQWVCQVA